MSNISVGFVESTESSQPNDWIRQAEMYLGAGEHLLKDTSLYVIPAVVLLGYAVELALKSFLLEKGSTTIGQLRSLGHNLPATLKEALKSGLPSDLLTASDAEQLASLFHALPGGVRTGKHRAGIYPVTCKEMHVDVGSGFAESVARLVEYCTTQACGPRDKTREQEERERLKTLLGGRDPGPITFRSKPHRTNNEPGAGE